MILGLLVCIFEMDFLKEEGLVGRNTRSGIPQCFPSPSLNIRNHNHQRENKAADSGSDSRNRRSGIRCRECDGFGHIQSECANTLKMNNNSFNSTLSDGDSNRRRDEEDRVSHQVALTTRSAREKTVSKDVPPHAPQDDLPDVYHQISTNYSDSSDEEELTDEAIIESYRDMYQNLMKVVKLNEKLSREKEDQAKRIKALEGELAESQKIQGDLSGEL